jgi:hypothetical protein
MRRRLLAVIVGGLLALTIAGPAFADTVPGPGNFRDSGDRTFLYAFGSVCSQTTCTDTNVFSDATDLQSGDTFVSLCVDQFTYPIRGGGRFRSLSGCAEVGPDVASDLSSGSVEATFLADSCGRRSCTTIEVSLSVSLDAVGSPNAYSYTQKNQYQNCTDTYRVRGEAADAEGTILLNGSSIDAFGQLGSESFAFSTRCR